MNLDLTDILCDEELSKEIESKFSRIAEKCKDVWQKRFKAPYPYKFKNGSLTEFIPQWWLNKNFH